jgi:hypothetical protein
MSDERKPWETPVRYNDAPEIPAAPPAEDDRPIDYNKGPHNSSNVFDEDEDDAEADDAYSGEEVDA